MRAKEIAEFKRNAYIIVGLMVSLLLLLLYNRQRSRAEKTGSYWKRRKKWIR